MNTSRANRSRDASSVNLSEIQDSVKECVRYILCRESGKLPIKRAEIMKHLSTVCQTPANQIEAVIVEADKALKQIYGYKLVQVEPKSQKQYIVVLNERNEFTKLPTVMDDHHKRLLAAALTHIFMTGAPVKEDDMWKFLNDAGLMEENDLNSRKLLTNKFRKQLYLNYEKKSSGDGQIAKGEFDWGERATEEVPKMFLLQKVARALERTPDHWCEQHKEATEDPTYQS